MTVMGANLEPMVIWKRPLLRDYFFVVRCSEPSTTSLHQRLFEHHDGAQLRNSHVREKDYLHH